MILTENGTISSRPTFSFTIEGLGKITCLAENTIGELDEIEAAVIEYLGFDLYWKISKQEEEFRHRIIKKAEQMVLSAIIPPGAMPPEKLEKETIQEIEKVARDLDCPERLGLERISERMSRITFAFEFARNYVKIEADPSLEPDDPLLIRLPNIIELTDPALFDAIRLTYVAEKLARNLPLDEKKKRSSDSSKQALPNDVRASSGESAVNTS